MLEFALSRHARRRMVQRRISEAQNRRALQNPDSIMRDLNDPELFHAVKRLHHLGGSSILRVVYNPHIKPWRIVTVFFEK